MSIKKSVRTSGGILALGVVAAATLVAPTAAFAATTDTGRADASSASEGGAPPVERFDVKIDGKTETVETNLPWMLATDAEGEEHFYVGPAALDRDVEGEVLDSWAGPEGLVQSMSAQSTAAGWSCEPIAYDPKRSGGQIRGYVGASCTGTMPSYRLRWQFERNASPLESPLTGWKRYSDVHTTAWTSAQATGTDVYAHCNTSDGRNRAYTTYHRGETNGGYVWSWYRSAASGTQLPCGYSEY